MTTTAKDGNGRHPLTARAIEGGSVLPRRDQRPPAQGLVRVDLPLLERSEPDPAFVAGDREDEVGHVMTDSHGLILSADTTAADLLGVSRTFLPGTPLPLYFAGPYLRAAYDLITRLAICRGWVRNWLADFHQPRGRRTRALGVSVEPLTLPNQAVRLSWRLHDPAHERWAEQSLDAERSLATSVFDTLQSVLLLVNQWGTILRCNNFTAQQCQLPAAELIGSNWVSLLVPADQWPAARQAMAQAFFRQKAGTFTSWLVGSGERRAVVWSVNPGPRLLVEGPGALVVGHDITELHQAQERALRAERLAAVGQLTAMLTHEGRNFLQATIGALERLSWRLQDNAEAQHLIRRGMAAQHGLARLFDDVMGLVRPLRLERAACELPSVWREVWAEVRAKAAERDACLVEDIAADLPLCSVDRFRLARVFRNLFDNSIAACPGTVWLQITARPAEQEHRPGVQVSVRDNGPGLTPEQRRRVFEPFFTTKAAGTGLGMTITKQVLEAHQGTITVGDAASGAEFLLWLPRDVT